MSQNNNNLRIAPLPDELPATDLTREIRRIQQILTPPPPAASPSLTSVDVALMGIGAAFILIPIIIAALLTLAE